MFIAFFTLLNIGDRINSSWLTGAGQRTLETVSPQANNDAVNELCPGSMAFFRRGSVAASC